MSPSTVIDRIDILLPWGSGQIALPSSNSVMFVPRHPYVPMGTLRGALAYPSPETAYTDEQIIAALQSAGLNRLSSSLDRVARWDRELTEDEQQCLHLTKNPIGRRFIPDLGVTFADRPMAAATARRVNPIETPAYGGNCLELNTDLRTGD